MGDESSVSKKGSHAVKNVIICNMYLSQFRQILLWGHWIENGYEKIIWKNEEASWYLQNRFKVPNNQELDI